jgi:hypothetical protein
MDMVKQFEVINNVSGKIDNAMDKLMNRFNSYLERLNNRIGKYMTPNKYLQPVILGRTGNAFFRVPNGKNTPAVVSSENMQLMPTTYTAETVCPAYKKFVAVTNVTKDSKSAKGGDATCKSILDQANSQKNFKKVIDGGYGTFIDFQGKKGYTYEILYSAVDYDGKVVAEKFYVKVAE